MSTLLSNVDDPQFSDTGGLDRHPELRDGLHSGAANAFVELATWMEDHEELASPMEKLLDLLGNVFGELPNAIGHH